MSRRKHSKITTLLPPELQEAINIKLMEGKTYQEITDWINSLGHDVSRASVGRYGKDFTEKLEELRQKKEQFKALLEQAKDDDTLTLVQAANNAVIRGAFEEFMLRDNLEKVSTEELSKMMARANRNALLQEKYQAEQRRKADEAVKTVEQAASGGTLDPETLRMIKEQIYGIL
ncbi:DUF3486 family protein [Sporomusa sphaeroides DSM 2875]|uniref:phage protein Gp27 family protein n=1 Tax=Sporomusa sphaeroides TaxID=47679 RepID=UPI002030F736|nr:phage protein Gp27 family protein [Sporomusa sphaeroides]MCM0757360.1 DUF3486 family protein [Sporomusa sphaeroides DSM 2875]